ncbi:hypothetical protein TIFTF001_055569, partial [Ficus carica]
GRLWRKEKGKKKSEEKVSEARLKRPVLVWSKARRSKSFGTHQSRWWPVIGEVKEREKKPSSSKPNLGWS